jgi:two-component system response regulator YesN
MNNRRNSKIRKQFFISYAVIFIIMISVVMSLYYVFYAKMLTDNELKVQEIVVSQMTDSIQQHFDNASKMISQFALTPWVRRMMYMQKDPESFIGKITPYDIYEYSKQILLTETTDSFGEKIIIYFNLTDKVLSDAGEFSWKNYVDMYTLTSDKAAMVNGTLFQQNNQRLIISSCRMKINAVMNDCLAYVQTIPLENYAGSNASVAFFIPLESIAEQSYSYFHNKNISIDLINSENNILPLGKQNEVVIPKEILAKLQDNESNFLYMKEQGQYIYYQKLSGIGLACLIAIPAKDIQSNATQIRQVFLALFIMMLAFVLLISYKMSVSYYRPIEKMITNISIDLKDNELPSGMSDNEYRLIETAFHSLSNQNKELNTVIFKQNPLIQRYILQKLLGGEKTLLEGSMLEYLKVINRYKYMNCIITAQTAKYKQVKKEILSCMESSPLLVYLEVEIQDKLVIIVNYDAPETLEIILEWIQQVFVDLGIDDIYLGVAREMENVLDIHQAYIEATGAFSYSYIIKDRCILYAEAFVGREHNKPELRTSDESKLLQNLYQGQAEEVIAAYQEILENNIKEHEISVESLFELIERLNKRMSQHLEKQYPGVLANLSLDAKDFVSLENYLLAYHFKIKKFCQSLNVENSGSNTVNKALLAYINDHITDTELSLQKTADYLGYTQTYLSRYFKEQFDCNYYEYVVKKRLMLAMDALSNHKYSINDIAIMSGFANDATFRRVFKMNMGMTPIQYRRQAIVKTNR